MNRIVRILAAFCLLTTLIHAEANKAVAPPENQPQSDATVPYVIGDQDILQINVWKEPEMSANAVPVRPDGKISLPLLGDIQAAGLTAEQLGNNIARLASKFVQDAKATVVVTTINSRRIFLVGEVGHPGPLAMLPDMTALQALASAGGVSQFAHLKKIYVLRTTNGTRQRLPFDYKQALKGDPKQDILLQPGDTIVVP